MAVRHINFEGADLVFIVGPALSQRVGLSCARISMHVEDNRTSITILKSLLRELIREHARINKDCEVIREKAEGGFV
jgi:hypothetical protein